MFAKQFSICYNGIILEFYSKYKKIIEFNQIYNNSTIR